MVEAGPYSKEVMKHFVHPKNLGSIKNPDGEGKVGNLLCGDVMKLYIKVKNKKLTDIKFETFGCVVAIANSSMISVMAKGKTLEQAMKITKNDMLKRLGDVPKIKIHCSILAVDALHEAIYDYFVKNKIPIPKKLQEEHGRIANTLETIEERHKGFVELEEKVLGHKH